jgi:hypothetical protein
MLASEQASNAQTPPLSTPNDAEGERQQVQRSLQTAMAGLAEDLRLPIVLHYVEGLNQNEVGRIIGVSQSQVARRIAKGLAFMRKELADGGVVWSAALIPQTLHLLSAEQAPATLQQALRLLPSRSFATNGSAAESLHGGFVSAWLKFGGAAVLIVAAAAGGLWAVWPLPSTDSETGSVLTPEKNAEVPPALWFFDFNHGKPTELRYIEGNWEHRPNGGTDDSGALWAISDKKPAVFALPENCPANVIVSFELICRNTGRTGLDWTWALEPVGRPEIVTPGRCLRLSAASLFFDGRRHRVNAHFSLDTGLILASISDQPIYLKQYDLRTIQAIESFAPAFIANDVIIDNLTVRAATAADETELKELWTNVENFELETYDYFDGVNSFLQNLGGESIYIAEDVHRNELVGGKPEKDIPEEFNFARGFKPTRNGNAETFCFWPNLAPESHLLRLDYFPENAKAASSSAITCHFLADKYSMANAKKADENFRLRGSPLKSLALHAADSVVALKVGQWHELEFYLTKDLVVCLANGRPWFVAKDPRAIERPEGIALFFGGHCRMDNLRGREFNRKDAARFEVLKKNLLTPAGESPPTK